MQLLITVTHPEPGIQIHRSFPSSIAHKSRQIAYTEPRKGGNYSDLLPFKAFGASNLRCRQTQCRFIQICCGAPR